MTATHRPSPPQPVAVRGAAARRARAILGVALAVTVTAPAVGCSRPELPDPLEEQRLQANQRVEEAKQQLANPEAAATPAAEKAAEPPAMERAGAIAELDPALAAQVVAKVGDAEITLGHVADYIASQPPHVQARYATFDGRKELLGAMVEFEVLAAEAKRRGLDQTLPVQLAWKEAMARELLRREAAGQVTMAQVTDADVKAWYYAHQDRFRRPERRRAAILISPDQPTAATVHAELTAAIEANPKLRLQVFGDFAAEKSVDPERKAKRGDMGWFGADGLTEKDQRRASALQSKQVYGLPEIGAVSAPFRLEDGRWAIVQVTNLHPEKVQLLPEVEQDVRNAVFRDKVTHARQKMVEGLVASATVQRNEAELSKLPAAEGGEGAGGAPPVPHIDPKMLRRGLLPRVGNQRPDRQVPAQVDRRLRMDAQEVLEKMHPQGGDSK